MKLASKSSSKQIISLRLCVLAVNFKQMKNILLLLIVLLIPSLIFSQEKETEKVKVSINGFVKNDMFWDSRQTISAREGHFLLFPAPVKIDADGNDINKGTNFNFLAIQSRVAVNIKGATALNAKISAKIEGDFFGQLNTNTNLFRLRHAYIKMNWTSTELLFGQYWIAMFVPECFPGTVSFNTGSPFQPFGRNPQVRLSQVVGKTKFMVMASSQRDYTSRGPNPAAPSSTLTSGQFMRNAGIPEFSGQIHVKPTSSLLLGIGASYKQIKPQIATANGYKTDETIGGFNTIAFMKLSTKNITFKLQGIYGQNMPDVLSIGGFGISDSTDIAKGFVSYTNLNTFSAWTDIHTNGKKIRVGIFGGYSKNLGANDDIIGPIYGLGTNIESMYRVSPRVSYQHKKLLFALEGEYTMANFGSSVDGKGVPIELTASGNFRVLFAAYYFF